MKEARRVIGLILAKGDLRVTDAMLSVGPLDGKVEGLPLSRHGEPHGGRQTELEVGGEQIPNMLFQILHRLRSSCPAQAECYKGRYHTLKQNSKRLFFYPLYQSPFSSFSRR